MTSVYIHWPFCLSKCPYCDFNSHVRDKAADTDRWAVAYKKELDRYAARLGPRSVDTVFFGGGTPSLMAPELVADIIAHIGKLWQVAPDAEITLEANPTSVEADKFAAFKHAGINRVSIGVQSLRQKELEFLGRQHDVNGAKKAIEAARQHFDRYSFDLIYARPEQTLADWKAELQEALELMGGHLSLYQLTIEKGTPFYSAYQKKEWALPDGETSAAMYELTRELMAGQGLYAYEISNYAKPGEESRHNMNYWRYGEYIGVGPGAHGRLHSETLKQSFNVSATMNLHHPEKWLESVEAKGHGLQSEDVLSASDILTEMVMMGTRLAEGLPRSRFRELCGAEPEALLDARKLELFAKEGLLTLDDAKLLLTERGRMLHQRIVGELLP